MPKLNCGEWMERRGVLVPERYLLEEARNSRRAVIGRSEHSLEEFYSGILTSKRFRDGIPRGYPKEFIKGDMVQGDRVKRLCGLLGIDEENVLNEFEVSYWKLLGGVNYAVAGDSAIERRHHITYTTENGEKGYILMENGKIVNGGAADCKGKLKDSSPNHVIKNISRLVGFYEDLRNNRGFSKK